MTSLEKKFVADLVGSRFIEKALTLFGIRRSEKTNKFDDYIGAVLVSGEYRIVRVFPGTTTPGQHWLLNPMNKKGTAIVPEGYYEDLFRRGLHKGYPALVQNKAIKLYRDNNKDGYVNKTNLTNERSLVGINLHRASSFWGSTDPASLAALSIGRWSAGCQVLASAKHFDMLMWMVNQVPEQRTFDYVLTNKENIHLELESNGAIRKYNLG